MYSITGKIMFENGQGDIVDEKGKEEEVNPLTQNLKVILLNIPVNNH